MSRAYRCLVADDHPALVAAVSDFLERQGFDVVGRSRDGVAAVANVKETKPDIALVDYRMPHLGGVELLEQIREAAPDTLIAVYTADTDQSIVGAVFDAGAHALILKDAPLADLAQALRTICAGQRYVDPALAQVMLNGHEFVACQARAAGIVSSRTATVSPRSPLPTTWLGSQIPCRSPRLQGA